ncbi:MAG TPA: trypsin-like peptidase domain-containing protein [Candidatus Krumholzibacteria bacterium]|nr:trypsin-like peptidase domain-containing protein [Candidatus Krumholzibacteria bacterium]HPD72670.1 trypsin-like peptidase domain-containing protein [Candidatus Krumholzibacteria bacterium]HRY40398.1 trypsin-like peptidase domain-containing protein [Candidatus Krumholzibacteria bacterium]
MPDRRVSTWSAAVIGLLAGALLGALFLLVRERSWRHDWESQRQAAIDRLLADAARDTVRVVEAGGQSEPAEGTAAAIDRQRANAIVAATRQVAPTVVTVTVSQRVAVRDPRLTFFDFFYPERSLPRLRYGERQSYGSGVIVGADGYIVTNAHVVGQSPTQITVTLSDGTNYGAELVEVVDRFDLALLKVDGKDLPVADLADSDDLMIGEWAIAIGSPFGQLLADTQPTVTVGVISALNRDIVRQTQSDRYYLGMIQTDAAINPGNSGGALVNARGEVVGINTFIFTESGGSIGIGFAVPANRVRWVLEEVREFGHYRQANWGVMLYPLTNEIMSELSISNPVGFIVRDVVEDSPAWRGGLRVYDVIRTINGVPLDSRDTVTRLVYEAMVGDRIHFTAERDGKPFSGDIVLEEAQR